MNPGHLGAVRERLAVIRTGGILVIFISCGR